jgi:hypothetical protein
MKPTIIPFTNDNLEKQQEPNKNLVEQVANHNILI